MAERAEARREGFLSDEEVRRRMLADPVVHVRAEELLARDNNDSPTGPALAAEELADLFSELG
jgi:hypothetical protein